MDCIEKQPAQRTVSFDANGGSLAGASHQAAGSDGTLSSLPTPTRDGYTFDGWYDARVGGTRVTTATVFTQDATIYAHWTIGTPEISYGEWIVTVPAQYDLLCYPSAGETNSSTHVPAKFGAYEVLCTARADFSSGVVRYFFISVDDQGLWFDFTDSMSVRENAVSCTVYFDPNGGALTGASSLKTDSDGTLPILPAASRSGYTFAGWYTARNGGTRVTTATAFTQDTVLYAHWTQDAGQPGTYTVTFDGNGGSGRMDPQTVTPSANGTARLKLPSCQFTAPSGKEFDHWTVNGKAYDADDTVSLTGDAVVKAVWRDKTAPGLDFTFDFDFDNMVFDAVAGTATIPVHVLMNGSLVTTIDITISLSLH